MADQTRQTQALGRILELVVVLSEDMTRGLERLGLTDSRAHLLWELHHRGPSTQRTLADALHVSARNITGLVDALVATGFVTREPHPTDRRATLVSFTEHGAATAAALERGQHEFARILFEEMPDHRLDGLVEGLNEVLDRLRKHGVSIESGADQ
ncbi:MarR family winged helix-turn-helix transcriptional regulator [Jiangella asiatica]|uniref:MarR family transcriptional regulator n=1 Tax=Jiangella asiatica TaxID=2530372 RepID=A0A4R5C9S4_9ACTN|nr:MarR family transcriptional regulator [Jiangella asiatica]TDD95416.1 MarR family transcriptional regulator [Jiangella asiatica]